MNKFGKPTEEDYQAVREVIKRMVTQAPEKLLARSQCESIPPYYVSSLSSLDRELERTVVAKAQKAIS